MALEKTQYCLTAHNRQNMEFRQNLNKVSATLKINVIHSGCIYALASQTVIRWFNLTERGLFQN